MMDLDDDDVEAQKYSAIKRNFSNGTDDGEAHKHLRNSASNTSMSMWDLFYAKQEQEKRHVPEPQLDQKLTLMDYIWKEQVRGLFIYWYSLHFEMDEVLIHFASCP